jgi:hypothetical protein
MSRARCGAGRCWHAAARRRARERRLHRVDFLVLDWQRLTEVFSKILNKSAQSGK